MSMGTHGIDDRVLILGADEQGLRTLQAQLELSGLRGCIAVLDEQLLSVADALSRPSLVIWRGSSESAAVRQLVDRMVTEGVPIVTIGAEERSDTPEIDTALHGDYTVSSLLETVRRFVDLPRPADVISMDRPRGSLVDEEAFFS